MKVAPSPAPALEFEGEKPIPSLRASLATHYFPTDTPPLVSREGTGEGASRISYKLQTTRRKGQTVRPLDDTGGAEQQWFLPGTGDDLEADRQSVEWRDTGRDG